MEAIVKALPVVVVSLLAGFLLPFFLLFSMIKAVFSGHCSSFEGKTVLVTGAGNGLGREMARQLARINCKVLCVDMKKIDLEETVRIIDEESRRPGLARAYVCDITDTVGVAALRDQVLQEFGKLDLLVNNAAFLMLGSFDLAQPEHIRRCMDVNILGAVWMTQAFLPSMKECKTGTILYINSIGGFISDPGMPYYCMSKHALSSLAQGLHEELRRNSEWDQIKICSAYPWFIASSPAYKRVYRSNLPTLPVEYTARCALEGARRGFLEFQIPGGQFAGKLTQLTSKIMPNAYYRMFSKAMGVEFAQITDEVIYNKFTSPEISHREVDNYLNDPGNAIMFQSETK